MEIDFMYFSVLKLCLKFVFKFAYKDDMHVDISAFNVIRSYIIDVDQAWCRHSFFLSLL